LIFKDLHEKGYFVLPGFKYGCDFCIYQGDPLKVHAQSLIFVDNAASTDSTKLNIIEIQRISMIAKKKLHSSEIHKIMH